MGRMIFDLTDDDREALEAHRIRLGLRSHAETLRALIRGPGGEPAMAAPPAPKPSFSRGRSKTVAVLEKRARATAVAEAQCATVPRYERKTFNPQPKKGKAK